MIIKNDDYSVKKIPNMKGGKGEFITEQIVPSEILEKIGKLFARGKLKPANSVGNHKHEKTMEICYVLEGSALVKDAERGTVRLEKGDTHICMPGEMHEIINDSEADFIYLAIVLNV